MSKQESSYSTNRRHHRPHHHCHQFPRFCGWHFYDTLSHILGEVDGGGGGGGGINLQETSTLLFPTDNLYICRLDNAPCHCLAFATAFKTRKQTYMHHYNIYAQWGSRWRMYHAGRSFHTSTRLGDFPSFGRFWTITAHGITGYWGILEEAIVSLWISSFIVRVAITVRVITWVMQWSEVWTTFCPSPLKRSYSWRF